MTEDTDSDTGVPGPCARCGSPDNCKTYRDGHSYCHTAGCNAYTPPTDGSRPASRRAAPPKAAANLIDATDYQALRKRGLTQATCEFWRYAVAEDNGKAVQVANYVEGGVVVGQKVRYPDKTFRITGSISKLLYGRHLWGEGGKMIVITEGELDALSVSQVQDNKWPVVSIPNGASAARKAIAANLEWLESFESVILMFDNDEAGRQGVEDVALLFTPGRLKIAKLPLKDASDMVQAGRERELVNALWRAEVYRPDGIVEVDDILEAALRPLERGFPWWLPNLDEATFGRRPGELYGLGAGTGIGKTDFITQQVAFDIAQGLKPACIFLEQMPTETLARVAGKVAGKAFHVPDGSWTEEERRAAFHAMRGKFAMYDSWGATEWEVVRAKIRYLAASGIQIFYLDHLTALADPSNERESLETLMAELAALANNLRVVIVFVSHLSTPDGRPHEEGGRVTIRHFKGSRAIGFWSHFLLGLERDQQAEDPAERSITTLRILKDRKTGRSTGKTFALTYDHATSRLQASDDAASYFPNEDGPNEDF